MRVVILRGKVSIGHFVRGSVDMRDVVRITHIFSFLSFIDTLFLYFRSCDHYWHTLHLSFLYVDVCFSFTYPLHVLFLFSLYTHASYYLYAIYYFCFTQRCLDEFCLKCFRNTGCQSLLAINPLFAKFFKSLYYDRFYCIQQVNISWVIYYFSHISFVCCGFVTDCQRGRLLGHM